MILIFEISNPILWYPSFFHGQWRRGRTWRFAWLFFSVSFYPEPDIKSFMEYVGEGNVAWCGAKKDLLPGDKLYYVGTPTCDESRHRRMSETPGPDDFCCRNLDGSPKEFPRVHLNKPWKPQGTMVDKDAYATNVEVSPEEAKRKKEKIKRYRKMYGG